MGLQSLGQDDPLEKEMTTLSSILAWEIPWRKESGGLKSLQSQSSVQFSSVVESYSTLCDPMNCSLPGLPVHHHLLEFTQTHIHQISDAIQQSHPLSSPFPPAPKPSQHQSIFQCQLFASGGQRTGISASASVLPKNIQD